MVGRTPSLDTSLLIKQIKYLPGSQLNERFIQGSLLIVGGTEKHAEDADILGRFIELAGGTEAPIAVITAASNIADQVWGHYEQAFAALGARRCVPVNVPARADASLPAVLEAVAGAAGIFIAGGDQRRLLARIGGTPLHEALHTAVRRGACLAGTSAGASALGVHMVTHGKAELNPAVGAAGMGAGLGFVPHCIIDQHFSQRHRINRLLSLVARNPQLSGIGIDEDTALLLGPGPELSVIGAGAVTVVDAGGLQSDIVDRAPGSTPLLLGVQLHVIPAGSRFSSAPGATSPVPAPLRTLFQQLLATDRP